MQNSYTSLAGYLDYEDPVQLTALTAETIIVICAALGVVLAGVACLVGWYKRKSNRQRNQMKHLKDQIDSIELKVRQCATFQ